MQFFNKIIKSILDFIFPYYRYQIAKSKIKKRIDQINEGEYEGNLLFIKQLDGYTIENLKPFQEHTFEIKKTIEEKSRALLISITISISLFSAFTVIWVNQDKFQHNFNFIIFLIIIIGVLSVAYMVISAIITLQLLGSKSKVYQVYPKDILLSTDEQVKIMAINIEQNTNMNILRSSLYFVSYQSIINSLICISIIFILFNINYITSTQNEIKKEQKIINNIEKFDSNFTKFKIFQDKNQYAIVNEIRTLKEEILEFDKLKLKYHKLEQTIENMKKKHK